jgi:probable F420-dependent oxidoreductase
MPSPADLRVGLQLPHQPALLRDLAVRAEALGYDSLWLGDHVAFHTPTLDVVAALAWVGAATRRVRLGPCVYLLALRHPVLAAKAVATLDVLSGGRVVFGVGVGGEYPPEFEAVGVPHRERGRRVDEGIAACRALWGAAPASFAGRHVRFADVALEPRPRQPGGPPVWIGGRSEHALARAARLGDGWVAYLVTPERFRRGLERIRALAQTAGRALPPAFAAAHLAFVAVDDDLARARATAAAHLERRYRQSFEGLVDRYCILGPPARCAEALAAFAGAGVDTLIVSPAVPPERLGEQVERVATEVVPLLGRAA